MNVFTTYNGQYIGKILSFGNFRKDLFFMEKFTVNLSEISDVEEFVRITANCKFDVTLSQGQYDVSGKSLMGIFSLDITKPVDVLVECPDDAVRTDFVNKIEKYIIA